MLLKKTLVNSPHVDGEGYEHGTDTRILDWYLCIVRDSCYGRHTIASMKKPSKITLTDDYIG